MTNLAGAVILSPDGAVCGEDAQDLQTAIDAGVLYICERAAGECPIGHHRGESFLHYAEGRGEDDYDAALEGKHT